MAQPPMDPLRAYAELGRIKLSEISLDGIFAKIADLAHRGLPGADEASITLLRDRPLTTAASSELARRLDEAQYEHAAGPCLQAAAGNTVVPVADTAADLRWPEWAGVASAAGIRSALSVALPISEAARGSLNLYSHAVGAFDDDGTAVSRTFAGYATVVLANALLYDTTLTLSDQLRQAMENRAVIEQAKGIVMSGYRCTPDAAFEILTRMSQDSNRKLRDIASDLVAQAVDNPDAASSGRTPMGNLPKQAE